MAASPAWYWALPQAILTFTLLLFHVIHSYYDERIQDSCAVYSLAP